MAGLLPLIASAQLVITNSYYVVLSGGTPTNPTSFVLTNPTPAGISNTGSGWIVSENEFNQIDWNIGTNTGSYIVPFGSGNTDYLPVTCNITTAGTGAGSIRFATYHGATWDNSTYKPSDVTNMSDFGAANYSNNAVDRFWILDAKNYTANPGPNITFTYIRNGASSEIAAPNLIDEHALIAQRFNDTATNNQWGDWVGTTGTDATTTNTGNVSSGIVTPTNFFRSWSLFNDSTVLAHVTEINGITTRVKIYPDPNNGNFTLTLSGTCDRSIVEIYNALGERIVTHSLASGNNTMEMNSEPNGVYLYRIIADNGNLVGEGKLVIRR